MVYFEGAFPTRPNVADSARPRLFPIAQLRPRRTPTARISDLHFELLGYGESGEPQVWTGRAWNCYNAKLIPLDLADFRCPPQVSIGETYFAVAWLPIESNQ